VNITPRRIAQALYRRLFVTSRGGGRPVPKAILDLEYSSGRWDHFASWDELPRYLVLAGAVHHHYPRPAVLDVGCGSGRLAQLFATYSFESYLGVDLSSEGVARARSLALPRMEFREADFENPDWPGTFDAIVLNEVIGYAADPGKTLARLAQSLRPGGRFFVSQYRFGAEKPLWRRIGAFTTVESSTAVTGDRQQTWDIKVLRPSLPGPG
jgi:SAM-dependent methyltransferase